MDKRRDDIVKSAALMALQDDNMVDLLLGDYDASYEEIATIRKELTKEIEDGPNKS